MAREDDIVELLQSIDTSLGYLPGFISGAEIDLRPIVERLDRIAELLEAIRDKLNN